jgi:hypothetical protein
MGERGVRAQPRNGGPGLAGGGRSAVVPLPRRLPAPPHAASRALNAYTWRRMTGCRVPGDQRPSRKAWPEFETSCVVRTALRPSRARSPAFSAVRIRRGTASTGGPCGTATRRAGAPGMRRAVRRAARHQRSGRVTAALARALIGGLGATACAGTGRWRLTRAARAVWALTAPRRTCKNARHGFTPSSRRGARSAGCAPGWRGLDRSQKRDKRRSPLGKRPRPTATPRGKRRARGSWHCGIPDPITWRIASAPRALGRGSSRARRRGRVPRPPRPGRRGCCRAIGPGLLSAGEHPG